MSNCSITVCHTSILYSYERNIWPSKKQAFLSYFIVYVYVYICIFYFYINNTAKGNTSLMLNKQLLLLLLL